MGKHDRHTFCVCAEYGTQPSAMGIDSCAQQAYVLKRVCMLNQLSRDLSSEGSSLDSYTLGWCRRSGFREWEEVVDLMGNIGGLLKSLALLGTQCSFTLTVYSLQFSVFR
jgi:hypothetical protein